MRLRIRSQTAHNRPVFKSGKACRSIRLTPRLLLLLRLWSHCNVSASFGFTCGWFHVFAVPAGKRYYRHDDELRVPCPGDPPARTSKLCVVYRPRQAEVNKLHQQNLRWYKTLMVETESVSETLVYINHPKWLSAREKILVFIRCKSFNTYAYLLLVTNRLFQEKVYEKLLRILGDSKRATTSRILSELDYWELRIKEAMKMFPGAPRIARYSTADVTVCKYGAGRVVPENPAVQHGTPNVR
jgi:hypothetical protein